MEERPELKKVPVGPCQRSFAGANLSALCYVWTSPCSSLFFLLAHESGLLRPDISAADQPAFFPLPSLKHGREKNSAPLPRALGAGVRAGTKESLSRPSVREGLYGRLAVHPGAGKRNSSPKAAGERRGGRAQRGQSLRLVLGATGRGVKCGGALWPDVTGSAPREMTLAL